MAASIRGSAPPGRRRRSRASAPAGQPQLREERAGHRVVPVLAGVDEDLVVADPDRRQEGGGLDEAADASRRC